MKKILIIAALAAIILIILVRSGIVDALLIFLLAGQVPGTNYTVPSSFMLLAILGALWLVIFRLAGLEMSRTATAKRAVKHRTERKKRLPKRRYQILSTH